MSDLSPEAIDVCSRAAQRFKGAIESLNSRGHSLPLLFFDQLERIHPRGNELRSILDFFADIRNEEMAAPFVHWSFGTRDLLPTNLRSAYLDSLIGLPPPEGLPAAALKNGCLEFLDPGYIKFQSLKYSLSLQDKALWLRLLGQRRDLVRSESRRFSAQASSRMAITDPVTLLRRQLDGILIERGFVSEVPAKGLGLVVYAKQISKTRERVIITFGPTSQMWNARLHCYISVVNSDFEGLVDAFRNDVPFVFPATRFLPGSFDYFIPPDSSDNTPTFPILGATIIAHFVADCFGERELTLS